MLAWWFIIFLFSMSCTSPPISTRLSFILLLFLVMIFRRGAIVFAPWPTSSLITVTPVVTFSFAPTLMLSLLVLGVVRAFGPTFVFRSILVRSWTSFVVLGRISTSTASRKVSRLVFSLFALPASFFSRRPTL